MRTHDNRLAKLGLAMAVTLIAAGMIAAEAASTVADAWTVTALQGRDASATVNVDGSVTAGFGAIGFPEAGLVSLIAESSGGSFGGDYVAAGALTVQLSIASSGVEPDVGSHVVLIGDSGREWFNYSLGQGANALGLGGPADGWTTLRGDGQVEWDADLEAVAELGVTIVKRAQSAQEHTVSGFTLTSERSIGESGLTPLEAALQARFGVTSLGALSDDDLAADSDGDGMTDVNEILAENDPDYFASKLFVADIVSVDESGVTVEWACVAGETYTVLRAAGVGEDFDPVSDPTTVDATGFATFTDGTAGDAAAFYMILQD